jgi:hypothetical protein
VKKEIKPPHWGGKLKKKLIGSPWHGLGISWQKKSKERSQIGLLFLVAGVCVVRTVRSVAELDIWGFMKKSIPKYKIIQIKALAAWRSGRQDRDLGSNPARV